MRHLAILLSVAVPTVALAQDRPAPPLDGAPPPDRSGAPGSVQGMPMRSPYLFVSPMGEPFRTEHPERAWFQGADRNGDDRIDRAEFEADAQRWFEVLDRQKDGEIDPDDVEVYERQLLPEVHVADGGGPSGGGSARGRRGGRPGGDGGPPGGGGGRGGGGPGVGGGPPGGGRGAGGPPGGRDEASDGGARGRVANRAGLQGAARYGYLDLPEPITPADTNFNRGISGTEFERAADQRFDLLDRNHDGGLTAGELPTLDTRNRGGPPFMPQSDLNRDRRPQQDTNDCELAPVLTGRI